MDYYTTLEPHTLLLLLLLLVTVYLVFSSVKRRSGLPPGPRPFPIIGNLHILKGQLAQTLLKIGQVHGDVFTLYYSSKPYVVLNTYGVIREAYVKKGRSFCARPHNLIRRDIAEYHGIVMNDGVVWQEQREFAVNQLHGFGLGKLTFEPVIAEEIRTFVECLKTHGGKSMNPKTLFGNAICNVICQVVLGRRFQYGDENMVRILNCMGTFSSTAQHIALMDIFPILTAFKFIPGDLLNYNKIIGSIKDIETMLCGIIEEHKRSFDGDNVRDFIDAYLLEMSDRKHASNFTDKQMLKVLTELFIGGTESTQTDLRWIMLFMLRHPEVCQKARDEILSVVGPDRPPSMNDKPNLNFCQAMLAECQRMGKVGNIGMMHCTAEEVELRGYTIPKGTSIVQNFGAVNFDPKLWRDPHVFDPVRFLDNEDKFFLPEHFIPFGLGPRSCIGKSLAKMELFLFTTSILQNFDIQLPGGAELPRTDGKLGITYSPYDFEICFVQR